MAFLIKLSWTLYIIALISAPEQKAVSAAKDDLLILSSRFISLSKQFQICTLSLELGMGQSTLLPVRPGGKMAGSIA